MKMNRDHLRRPFDSDEDTELSDQQKRLPQPPLVKEPMSDVQISLPVDFENLKQRDLLEVIRNRKSNRVYTQENISLLQLSYLLWATQGIRAIRGKSYATLRTVPSGGARHGFETYLCVNYVEGLQPGKYHYLPMGHKLEYLGPLSEGENIKDSLCGQLWGEKASVVFYWSFVPYRCEWRYSNNAYRPALIDMGHVGENLYLACSNLQLGTCGIAAFDIEVCNKMFKLDGVDEFMLYTQPVGTIKEEDKAAEDSFYAFVKEEGL